MIPYIIVATIVFIVGAISVHFIDVARPPIDFNASDEDRIDALEQTVAAMGRWFARLLTASVAFTAAIIVGIAWNQDTAKEVQRNSDEDAKRACEGANEFRRFFFDILDPSDPGEPVEIDVTDIPGYEEMDPGTKRFVDAVVAQSNLERVQEHQDALDYRKEFPIRNCDALPG